MFIAAGIVAILCVSGVIDFNFSIYGWWALFIIIPCLVSLLCGKDPIGSLVGIGVGILLMLAARGVIEWSSIWIFILAAVAIGIGLKILFSTLTGCRFAGSLNHLPARG